MIIIEIILIEMHNMSIKLMKLTLFIHRKKNGILPSYVLNIYKGTLYIPILNFSYFGIKTRLSFNF